MTVHQSYKKNYQYVYSSESNNHTKWKTKFIQGIKIRT